MAQLLVLLLFGFLSGWLWWNLAGASSRWNCNDSGSIDRTILVCLSSWRPEHCVRAISRKQKKLPHPSSCSSNVLSHSCWSWKWTMTRFHAEARVPGNKAETRGNKKKLIYWCWNHLENTDRFRTDKRFLVTDGFVLSPQKKIFDGDLLIGKDCEICLTTCVFVWVCQGFITCLSEVWSGFVGVIYQSTCPAPNKRNGRWSRSPDNKYHNHRMWSSSKMVKYDVGSTTCSFNDIKIILNYPFWCFSEICIDRDRPQS